MPTDEQPEQAEFRAHTTDKPGELIDHPHEEAPTEAETEALLTGTDAPTDIGY